MRSEFGGGCLRLGSLSQMPGKHALAIYVYDAGHECTMGTDADHFMHLLESKVDAIIQSEHHLSLLGVIDVRPEIIPRLPPFETLTCTAITNGNGTYFLKELFDYYERKLSSTTSAALRAIYLDQRITAIYSGLETLAALTSSRYRAKRFWTR
ncbi:hypothetical protein BJV82DRAFT_581859 [Fennellomyces sp. T-0311]|nr:hypothetical protein BJV82DRAFT_581859 [Fennellomyces sp. T-0311]